MQVLCLNNNRIESIFPRQKWGKQKSNPANGDSEDPHDGDMDNGNCRILLKLEVLHLGWDSSGYFLKTLASKFDISTTFVLNKYCITPIIKILLIFLGVNFISQFTFRESIASASAM